MPSHASEQPLPEWVTWACCDQVDNDGTPCTGAAQADYGRCLGHLDDTQLANVMTRRPDEAPPDVFETFLRLQGTPGLRLTNDGLRDEGFFSLVRRSWEAFGTKQVLEGIGDVVLIFLWANRPPMPEAKPPAPSANRV